MSTQPSTHTPKQSLPYRLLLGAMLVAGAAGGGAYAVNQVFLAPRRKLEVRVAELDKENNRLKTYLKLLEFTERRAQLEVISQIKTGDGETFNRLRFTELDPQGGVIGEQRVVEIVGDEVYIDTLVIKFEDHFIEQGDPLRGKALLVFRRIFTNRVKPDDGYDIDRNGVAPALYAARTAPTAFEKNLWTRFWEVANNEELAKRSGVKAIHGQAISGRLLPNRIYTLLMRATGEVILTPPKEPPPGETPTPARAGGDETHRFGSGLLQMDEGRRPYLGHPSHSNS